MTTPASVDGAAVAAARDRAFPAQRATVAASAIETGLPVAAIDRVRLMSADEWEDAR